MMAVKLDRPLNQYPREELLDMHYRAIIDYCPKCKMYHQKLDKKDWPMANVYLCDNCEKQKKEKESTQYGK